MNDEQEPLLMKNRKERKETSREELQEELKHVSFEDLQKLQSRLGTKVYNETVFGRESKRKVEFKRENKNRPREMSSKRPVPDFKFNEMISDKKIKSRDPRFDSLCGTFDKKAFRSSYSFLNKVRKNDLKALKKELTEATDPKSIKKIKYLIQRIENQMKEEKREKDKEKKKQQEKKELLESIRQGKKPAFKKKSEKKILDLVKQYEELKDSGKLKKHIQRLRKKNKCKDKAKLK